MHFQCSLCFLLAMLFAPAAAFSCSPAFDETGHIKYQQTLPEPSIVFEGLVLSADKETVTIRVDNAKTGAKTGDVFKAAQSHSTCNLAMEEGMAVSFAGNLDLSGKGTPLLSGNFQMISVRKPDTPMNDQTVFSGVLAEDCAPWDGAAFSIRLENNIAASVYDSIRTIENTGGKARFRAGGAQRSENGGAVLLACGRDGQNCRELEGDISLTGIKGDDVDGLIEIPTTGERYVFRVRYDRSYHPLCG